MPPINVPRTRKSDTCNVASAEFLTYQNALIVRFAFRRRLKVLKTFPMLGANIVRTFHADPPTSQDLDLHP